MAVESLRFRVVQTDGYATPMDPPGKALDMLADRSVISVRIAGNRPGRLAKGVCATDRQISTHTSG
jgi:hypothetical protein